MSTRRRTATAEGEAAIRAMTLGEFSDLLKALWLAVITAKTDEERAAARDLHRWTHDVRQGLKVAA